MNAIFSKYRYFWIGLLVVGGIQSYKYFVEGKEFKWSAIALVIGVSLAIAIIDYFDDRMKKGKS